MIACIGRLRTILFMFAALSCGVAFAQAPSWEQLMSAGVRAYRQGDFDGALDAFGLARDMAEGLPEGDPRLRESLFSVGRVLAQRGRAEEAEAALRRAIALEEKALGPDHPEVATSINLLAETLGLRRDYAKAEPLFLRALAIRERALGPEHPDVAAVLTNLGTLYRFQGRFTTAEPYYRRAL